MCGEDDFAKNLLYVDVPKYFKWSATKQWIRRKQGERVEDWPNVRKTNVIGRVYTVHVANFECFCLRMLLFNIRGPTKFEDCKNINGRIYESYSAACRGLGLLENDDQWNNTMLDGSLTNSPTKLRNLFAILLGFCGVSEPLQLWNNFKNNMSEDYLFNIRKEHPNADYSEIIYNKTLISIEDELLRMCGKNLENFGMPSPDRERENQHLFEELNYDIDQLKTYVNERVPLLSAEQKIVYDFVLNKIDKNEGCVIFLDAVAGTGKTFLLNLILASVRIKGIALAIASSGIAATLLDGGRTAHSLLKLPLNLHELENPTCNLNKESPTADVIKKALFLAWDECTMSHKKAFEACDATFKDIRNNQNHMGNLVVLLSGDFRQTLPVISKGTSVDEINSCLKTSYLWKSIKILSLKTNMRVRLEKIQGRRLFQVYY